MNDIPSSLYHLDLSFIHSTYNHYYLLSYVYIYTHISQMNEYSIFTTTKL